MSVQSNATSDARGVDLFAPLGLLLVLGIWWIVSATELVERIYLPHVTDVFAYLVDNFGRSDYISFYGSTAGGIGGNLLYTTLNVVVAVLVACTIGILTGLYSTISPIFHALFRPLVLVAGTLPVLVLAPYFLIGFGVQRWTQVVIVGMYSLPILYIYTRRAVLNSPSVYEQNATLLGARGLRIVRNVYLPGALPEVVGGIRIAFAGSWGLAAIAEQLGAGTGLGKLIGALATATDVTGIVACTLALAFVAVAVDLIVVVGVKAATRWR